MVLSFFIFYIWKMVETTALVRKTLCGIMENWKWSTHARCLTAAVCVFGSRASCCSCFLSKYVTLLQIVRRENGMQGIIYLVKPEQTKLNFWQLLIIIAQMIKYFEHEEWQPAVWTT